MNPNKPKPLTEDEPGYQTEQTAPQPKPLTEDEPGFQTEQEESEGLPPGTALTEAL